MTPEMWIVAAIIILFTAACGIVGPWLTDWFEDRLG